jgi:hypothetical protein
LILHREKKKLVIIITPWDRALLEKLKGSQQLKKFPAFYTTRRLTTAFTCARHLSLSIIILKNMLILKNSIIIRRIQLLIYKRAILRAKVKVKQSH